MKSSQLRRQVSLRLLCLLPKVGLFLQLGQLGCQLLIESTDGLLILVHFLIFDLLMLAESSDHPLVGHTFVLVGLHLHQFLK